MTSPHHHRQRKRPSAEPFTPYSASALFRAAIHSRLCCSTQPNPTQLKPHLIPSFLLTHLSHTSQYTPPSLPYTNSLILPLTHRPQTPSASSPAHPPKQPSFRQATHSVSSFGITLSPLSPLPTVTHSPPDLSSISISISRIRKRPFRFVSFPVASRHFTVHAPFFLSFYFHPRVRVELSSCTPRPSGEENFRFCLFRWWRGGGAGADVTVGCRCSRSRNEAECVSVWVSWSGHPMLMLAWKKQRRSKTLRLSQSLSFWRERGRDRDTEPSANVNANAYVI
jgi:hypothetical protein